MIRVEELDPFNAFRTAIFVGVGAYTLASLTGTAVHVAAFLRRDDAATRFVRRYLSYQLVTIRLRPLAGELIQIALLAAGLAAIWWAHRALDRLGA